MSENLFLGTYITIKYLKTHILEQIRNPRRHQAMPPTGSKQGAWQQTWTLNMNEYREITTKKTSTMVQY